MSEQNFARIRGAAELGAATCLPTKRRPHAIRFALSCISPLLRKPFSTIRATIAYFARGNPATLRAGADLHKSLRLSYFNKGDSPWRSLSPCPEKQPRHAH